MSSQTSHSLLLRALILTGVLAFAFYVAADRGLIQLALASDRSYLSYVILGVYALASAHWLYLALGLSNERRLLTEIEFATAMAGRGDDLTIDGRVIPTTSVTRYFVAAMKRDGRTYQGLLDVLADRVNNRHATGHFVADTLLKLGLLGTIVGFILMLLPVAEIENFDPGLMQGLLGEMSQGMAVALYTTLAGLTTSTLLKLQYQVLDSAAADLVTRIAEISAERFVPGVPKTVDATSAP